jgi:hypothetical protein
MDSTNLKIEKMLAALKAQAIYGRTHLYIARGLVASKPSIGDIAPRFFEMTLDAHLQAAQLYAAKLYDKQSKSVKVLSFIEKAARSEAKFPLATPSEVRQTVEIAIQMMSNLEPTLDAVQIRRNEYLAHLAPTTVIDIASMHDRAALTISDLDFVFVETTNILNMFSQMIDGAISVPTLPDSDDFEVVLRVCATKKD